LKLSHLLACIGFVLIFVETSSAKPFNKLIERDSLRIVAEDRLNSKVDSLAYLVKEAQLLTANARDRSDQIVKVDERVMNHLYLFMGLMVTLVVGAIAGISIFLWRRSAAELNLVSSDVLNRLTPQINPRIESIQNRIDAVDTGLSVHIGKYTAFHGEISNKLNAINEFEPKLKNIDEIEKMAFSSFMLRVIDQAKKERDKGQKESAIEYLLTSIEYSGPRRFKLAVADTLYKSSIDLVHNILGSMNEISEETKLRIQETIGANPELRSALDKIKSRGA
jgi:hypothetical protein